MNPLPQLPDSLPVNEAVALTAFVDFLNWTTEYGHEIRESRNAGSLGIDSECYPVILELSGALSAAVNFGYDPNKQAIFIALHPEEFKWLPHLPVEEVVIGCSEIYVLTAPMNLEGEAFAPMAIAVTTSQPKLWRAFPNAKNISFMCITLNDNRVEVAEFASRVYPLRCLND